MNRYQSDPGVEGEYEEGSRGLVLRNRCGIKSPRKMDQAEAEALLRAQQRFLLRIAADTRFTISLIKEMHAEWLGGIYEWAGRFRTVEMSKGGFVWPPAIRVAANMTAFERDTLCRRTPCRGGDMGTAARAMAEVQAELLLVHPFREGNGRIARWLADLMALQVGFPMADYGFSGRGGKGRREQYLRAVVAGYARNYDPLARVVGEALRRALARSGLSGANRTPRAPSK
jgi:cell filamentation protein